VLLGRFEDRQLHVTEQVVVVAKQRQVHFDALLHSRIGEPLGDTHSIAL
jgi:hypothetical protein